MNNRKQVTIIFGIFSLLIILLCVIFQVGNISIIYFNFSPFLMLISIGLSIIFQDFVRILIFKKFNIEFRTAKKITIQAILSGILYSWLSIFVFIFLSIISKIPTESIRFLGLLKLLNVFLFIIWNLMIFNHMKLISDFIKIKMDSDKNGTVNGKPDILKSKNALLKDRNSQDPFEQYIFSKTKPDLLSKSYPQRYSFQFIIPLLCSVPILFMHPSLTPYLAFLWVYLLFIAYFLLKSAETKGTWFAYSFIINFWLIIPWI